MDGPRGPLRGPGSKGSEDSACLWQAGSKGGGIALWAMSIKSALRDLAFCVIWHDKHYVDQPPPVAFPPPLVAPATKGGDLPRPPGQLACFPTPAGRLYGFRRQRRYKKWSRRRRTSPAGTVSQPIGKPFNGQAKGLLWLTWRSYTGPPQYFIPPEGGSPQTVREASAGPGQNPWRPGPEARRRHHPSRP